MKILRIVLVVIIALSFILAPAAAMASKAKSGEEGAKGPSEAREIWDTVWKFLNFFILVFALVKYGRKPLMSFLSKQSVEIGERIEESKDLLAQAEEDYQATEARLSEMENLIQDIRGYMQDEAVRTKKRIVDEARSASEQIVAESRDVADVLIRKAHDTLKAELVEMAMAEVEKRIRESITREDEDRLIGEYVDQLAAEA
ncbi:MAG: ATP synthase F0 subunit B [Proteobacteria bacterium]|nr:ATP synthase F0 subunit B [Pseudomonadota bacterium]